MNNDKINKLGEGPLNEAKLLQPLREVGSHKKTQYWTFEDIEDAIRKANLLGIDPEKLYRSPAENS